MPEVRPPKDESWRTVTLPEAVYVKLKEIERKFLATPQPAAAATDDNWCDCDSDRGCAKLIGVRVPDGVKCVAEADKSRKPAAAVEGTGEPSPAVKRAATIFHNAESANFLKRLRTDRGAIVSSADCTTMEIAFAQKEKRWYVDEDGMGYVIRMKEWREESERLIRDRCEARDVSDSPVEPAPAPPAEWKVVQRKDTAEWILEIAGPKLATQAEAEAAAAKVNGTCHHISTLQREHKQMAAEISRLKAELAAAEKDRDDLQFRIDSISE